MEPATSTGESVVSDDALFATLTHAEHSEELPRTWLTLQCRLARGSRRGLLLLGPPDRGPFAVAAAWPEGDSGVARSLSGAAEQALIKRSGFTRAPGARDATGPAPLEGALVAEPVQLSGALHGAVVLEVSPRTDAELEALRDQLRLGFGWLDAYVQRRRVLREGIRKEQLEIVLGLLAVALEHEAFQGAVTTFATELATELGCDRVSIGMRHRQKIRVEALSHSAHFTRRTNLIRAVEGSMDEALDQEASVVFPSPGKVLARAAHAHMELARQFGSDSICTVALVRAGKSCGAITLERSKRFDESTVMLLEVVAALAGPMLDDRRRNDRFVGSKVVDSLYLFFSKLLGPHHMALKLGVLGAVSLVTFMTFAHGGYRVSADTVVEPSVKRAAVSPFEGFIATAPVRPGDVVHANQVLGTLDDRDLQLERAKWESQWAQALKEYRHALAERDAALVEIKAAAVEEARAQLDLIRDRLSRTELRSPFEGIVVTGDLSQRLGAPVKRGEVLFEVAPLEAFRLYLKVDESDVAQVREGQHGSLVLSALPQQSFRFQVEKITPVSSAAEGRNAFRVEASLEGDQALLHPGEEGVAKIEVGERRLIWIWTHDFLDWVRLKIWSWTP